MDLNTKFHDQAKFRVLMIHGFAQTASEFRAKASRIANRINDLLAPEILLEFPSGIEFLYPDAPWALEAPIGYDESLDNDDEDNSAGVARESINADRTNLGWWYGRDNVSRYRGLEVSLFSLAKYIYGRPIHGVIGFSQGACLAGMVCSLLESRDNPEKLAAIRSQHLPVDDFLRLPGQAPLRFYIGLGGYCSTRQYYGSLYRWPLRTPSCHTLASMDAIVNHHHTVDWAQCFASYELVHYFGSHFVPRDRASVEALALFALQSSCVDPAFLRFPSVAALPGQSDTEDSRSDGSQGLRSVAMPSVCRKKRKTCVPRARRTRVVIPRRLVPSFKQSPPWLLQ